MIGCITGVQRYCKCVAILCVGIKIVLIASCRMYLVMGRVRGDISNGVGFCIFFLPVFLSIFDRLGVGM